MDTDNVPHLQILVFGLPGARLDQVTDTVGALGHQVMAAGLLSDVPPVTAAKHPDVAIAVVQEASAEALQLIDRIVRVAACPVIAVLDVQDRSFINAAAQRGIFAYVADGHDPEEMQSSIDIVLRRFAEYHDLEGAFGRRAITERAKGILMERHDIDERTAFDLLRDEARRTNRKVVDLAEAIVSTRHLLRAGADHAESPDPANDDD